MPLVMVWGLNINTSHNSLMSSRLEAQSFENILESGDSDHGPFVVSQRTVLRVILYILYTTNMTKIITALEAWNTSMLTMFSCTEFALLPFQCTFLCVIYCGRSTVLGLFQLAPFQPDKSAVHSTKAHIGCAQQLIRKQ